LLEQPFYTSVFGGLKPTFMEIPVQAEKGANKKKDKQEKEKPKGQENTKKPKEDKGKPQVVQKDDKKPANNDKKQAADQPGVEGQNEEIQKSILKLVDQNANFFSRDHVSVAGGDHDKVVGALNSLSMREYLVLQLVEDVKYSLSKEAEDFVANGSPEFQVYQKVPAEGFTMKQAQDALGQTFKFGFSNAKSNGWIELDKASGLIKK